MQVTREVGIKLAVDSTAVAVGTLQAARDFDRMGTSVEQAGERSTRSLTQVSLELKNIVAGAAALSVVSSLVSTVADALTALPRDAFNYTKNIEASTVGMAGILGSMTAINGQQTEYNTALTISSQYIRKLNDDALRTAATSQELVATFQALLAPGLAAKMTLEQIRELSVVGTNAVKSIGLEANQVVQELRDLVAGGITASSSQLATALGLRDEDIAKAKASSEGLFAFLMERLKGFSASSEAFGGTLQGSLDSLKEGAVRVAAEGMAPLTNAIKATVGEASKLFSVIDAGGNAQLNPALVESITEYAEGAAKALDVGKQLVGGLYEHRDAVLAVWTAYKAFAIGAWAAEAVAAVRVKLDLAAAARLAATQASVEGAANAVVAQTTREKAAAYLAELEALRQKAQATLADASAQVAETTAKTASLAVSREAVVVARAEVTAKLQATQATIAQAQAQLAASQAAGALSYAMALQREATVTLAAAQTAQAALVNELAVLGRQQATVAAAAAAAITAQTQATAAHTVAMAGAELATNQLAAATARGTLASAAAGLAARGFGVVLAAFGGPVGIAVAALVGLVSWLFRAKSESDDAALAAMRLKRARDALAEGKPVNARDIVTMSAELEKARQSLDEIEQRQTSNTTAAARKAAAMAVAQAKVKELEDSLNKAQTSTQASSAESGLTLSLASTQQAWEKTISTAKTATAAQEEYQQKIDASRASFSAYQAMLEKTGASTDVIAKAQKRQAETEAAFAAERDRKLKEMNATAVTATSQSIDAQVEQLKRKAQVEEVLDKRATDMLQTRLQLGLVSERDYLQQVAAAELQGLAKTRELLTQELALVSKKKDSLKEQANISGQIAQVDEKRLSRELTLQNALLVLDEKRRKEAEALHSASINTSQQEVDALEEKNRLTLQEIEAIGLTTEQMQLLTNARLDDIIARQQERIAVLQAFDDAQNSQDLIDIEIRKLEALKNARNLNDRKYGVEQIAKINEAWLTLKNDVYQGLTDSLYRAFEAGNGFFATFWAGIVNTLKTTVLKVAVQGVVSGITGSLGLGSVGGSGGGVLSTLSNLSSLNSFTSLLSNGIGQTIADVLPGAISSSLGMTSSALMASNAALAGGGSAGAAAASAAAAAGNATALGSISSTLAAIPGWGWALAGAAVLASMDWGGGGGGGGKTGTVYGTGVDNFKSGYAEDLVHGNFQEAPGKAITQSIEQGFATYASALGDKNSTFAAGVQYAMDNAGSGDALTQLQVVGTVNGVQAYNRGDRLGGVENVARGDDALKAAVADESLRAIYAGLQASNIPQQIKDYLAGVDIGADATLLQQRLNETLQVQQLSTAYGSLNNDLTKVFASSVATSQALIKAAGGFDAFTTKYNSYLQNFYSDSERQALATANVSAEFTKLGLTMPTTRDEFRAMVESASKTLDTDAGIAAYNALLSLSDAFASIVPASLSAADALAAQRKATLDLVTTNASASYTALEKAISAQRTSAELALSVATEQVNTIQGVFDTLKSNISSLYGEVSSTTAGQAAQGQDFLQQALATARRTGYLPDNTALTDAISAARGGVQNSVYGSQFEADYARLSLAGTLSQLQDLTGTQLTTAEQTLKAAQAQVDGLDGLLENAKLQLDAANGIDVSVQSVAAALASFNANILALVGERAGQSLTTSAVPAFAAGGTHDGGWRLVGENGPELELTGASRIYSASQTRELFKSAGNSDAAADTQRLESLVEALTAEVQRLRTDVQRGNVDAKRSAEALNGNTERPMLVEVVPA